MTNHNSLDRYTGLLLGLACGDALGAQVEFKSRGSFPRQVDLTGGGPHQLSWGEWTDDTAMALILTGHLASDPSVKASKVLVERWVGWMDRGEGSCTGECFDIGRQTSAALRGWKRGVAPDIGSKSRGNGALMRVAPCAMVAPYASSGAAAYNQAVLTHPQVCAELCVTFVGFVAGALRTKDPLEFRDRLRRYNGPIFKRKRADVPSTGFDLHTYEAALWCVMHADSAEEAIVEAVNLGDDADTTGAVTGALAGATWGEEALPPRWLDRLAWSGELRSAATALLPTKFAEV